MQSYLRHQGRKINERFDANTYVRLTQAMNDYDLSRGRGEYPVALSCIRQPALVISISSDTLYPPQEQQVLADALPNACYEILDSPEGHDGFLIQSGELGDLIVRFREGRAPRQLRVASGRARLSAFAE
jgi:homoserine O-acetyltransferase